MSADFQEPQVLAPRRLESAEQLLFLDSSVGELPLWDFQVEADCLARDVLLQLEHYPDVPGVVVTQSGRLLGVLSRQRLLEWFLHPDGTSFLATQTIGSLTRYAPSTSFVFPLETPILQAAQRVLQRSIAEQHEPVVVQWESNLYCILHVAELHLAYWQLRGVETQVRYEQAQLQLIQSEKMASLGRLVSGIAHELLDPIGFIWGNLSHLANYVDQLLQLLSAYEQASGDTTETIDHLRCGIELDYIREDLPQSLRSIQNGAERLKNLTASLQNFCYIDDVYAKPTDLHQQIDYILLLLKSKLTNRIRICREYEPLPPVSCFAGQMSQVFVALLTHAIHALLNWTWNEQTAEELGRSYRRFPRQLNYGPELTIATQVLSRMTSASKESNAPKDDRHLTREQLSEAILKSRWVSIRISHNGPRLSDDEHQNIVDAFSSQLQTAKETDLALSYRIVTGKHGGYLRLRSPCYFPADLDIDPNKLPIALHEGWGSEFEILLPMG